MFCSPHNTFNGQVKERLPLDFSLLGNAQNIHGDDEVWAVKMRREPLKNTMIDGCNEMNIKVLEVDLSE